ncbi:MAG: ArnT family glycosyltransferase [Armatimonadota bacterium]
MLERLGRVSVRGQRVILIVGCLLMYGLWLSWVPLSGVDELRYSEATREMVSSGEYIIPYFNFTQRYQKPILYYWVQAASVRLFGVNEVAARLPSALMALGLVLLVHGFLLRWLPTRLPPDDREGQARARGAAWLGAIALGTVPLCAIWARAAVTDMMLTLCIALSALALLHADLLRATGVEPRQIRRWYLWAAVAAALAFLTKGPVGLVIPALVWLLYHLRQRDLRQVGGQTPWVSATALFLVVAAPWYAATYLVDGPGFLRQFFLSENVARFTTTQEGHGADSYFVGLLTFLPVAILALFPYSATLLRDLLLPFSAHAQVRDDPVLARIRRFGWAWIWGVIGLFSLSRTQLPSYIQSIIGGMALVIAVHALGRFSPREEEGAVRRRRWADALEVGVWLLLGTAFTGGVAYALQQEAPGGSAWVLSYPQPAATVVVVLTVLSGLLFLFGVLLACQRPALCTAWVAATWTLLMSVLVLGAGSLYTFSTSGVVALVGQYVRQCPANEPLLAYCGNTPEGLVYYARRPVVFCTKSRPNALARVRDSLRERPSALLVTDATGLQDVRAFSTPTVLHRVEPLLVVRITPLPHLGGNKP